MEILKGILLLFLGLFLVGFIYQLWGMIGGALSMGSLFVGSWIGKILKIKPREKQGGFIITSGVISNVLVEWGLGIWAIFILLSFFWDNNFIEQGKYWAGVVWALALLVNIFSSFFIGIIFEHITNNQSSTEN